jgi:CheY-like chemotaxis protein
MVLEKLNPMDALYSQVQEILKAGNRAADLTRQLLAFSRRQIIQPQTVQLNKVVKEMDRMLRRLIGEDVDLAVNLEPGLGLVKADPSQIEQVIMNLALNSRDAMPEGGKLTIETYNEDLSVKTHEGIGPGRFVAITVRDTGMGMDPETQARIFEPFFTTKEKGKGTGLGLSTAYGIVRQSGGYISVSGRVGEGSSFTIRLPRLTEEEKVPDVLEMEQATGPKGSETILLVEDEAGVRKLIEAILRHSGYKVLEAPGAEEAIALCENYRGPIHLLLTDVVMPGMSGREMAERLCQLRKDMQVVYMSGYTDDAIVRHGVLDAGVAFLPKPFTPESLGQMLREVLDRKNGGEKRKADR